MSNPFADLIPKKKNNMFGDLIPDAKTPARASMTGNAIQQTIANIPGSAQQFLIDTAQPFIHPIETAQAIGNLGLGAVEKLIPGEQGHEQYADAVGQYFGDRYGSFGAIGNTLVTDPVGAAADAAALFTGGGTLAGRLPGIAGQVGRATARVGKAIDPLRYPAKAASNTVKFGAQHVLGMTSGAGSEAVRQAFRAGARGGDDATAFLSQMRGPVSAKSVVNEARAVLQGMRASRSAAYLQGRNAVGQDTTVIDFQPIVNALASAKQVGRFKGKVLDDAATATWAKIDEAVTDWQISDPLEFHTPLGLDALKQKIGNILDGTQHGTPERVVATRAYAAIKDQIVQQAPDYAVYMKEYEEASDLIREMEQTLSLNPRANVDTTLRKLQSVMRNNVNTNYGRRVDLANILAEKGAPQLFPKIAGQAMNSITPRGLQGAVASGTGLFSLMQDPANIKYAPFLAVTSPRAVGEGAYYAGKASNLPWQAAGAAAFQSGRISDDVSLDDPNIDYGGGVSGAAINQWHPQLTDNESRRRAMQQLLQTQGR